MPTCVGLAAVACTPPGGDGAVVVVDGLSFDGGPESLAALLACPMADRALAVTGPAPADLPEPDDGPDARQPGGAPLLRRQRLSRRARRCTAPGLHRTADAGQPSWSWATSARSAHGPGPTWRSPCGPSLYFAAYVIGESAADDARCRAWLDTTMSGLTPYSAGSYTGDRDEAAHPDRFLSDAARERYRRVRAARDPDEVFPDRLRLLHG
ncbi:hypothetical protein [Nocardioides convexus]|uniref:hypothetical protein n=1 Tax=Nocardioides convexus TaxID=2712224 RepID=UPI0024182DB5|nr:hypothetical protein [Nocardioides convexus]